MDELILKNQLLEEANQRLQEELTKTKEQLSIYTNNTKRYYAKNKEEIIQKVKEYKQSSQYVGPSPDVIKERNKRAYLKRKEKMLSVSDRID